MAKKSVQRDTKPVTATKLAHKQVTLHHHHAKPYRKRHFSLLVVMIAFLVLLSILLAQYREQVVTGLSSSRSFISDLFTGDKDYTSNVSSSYGFHLSYDQKKFYASAVSGSTGDLFIGEELTTERAYNIVRIAPNYVSNQADATKNTALTVTFHPGPLGKNDSIDAIALQDGGIDPANLQQGTRSNVLLDGTAFTKTYWKAAATGDLPAGFAAKFITYTGLVQGNPVTIVLSLGVGSSAEVQYNSVLDSVRFSQVVGRVTAPSTQVASRVTASRSVLDIITNTSLAAAASSSAGTYDAEQIAALYSPAVPKIYNAYCMDILLDGKAYLEDVCSGSSGSGFFVSSDGFIGTNGHVAVSSPRDLVISNAIDVLVSKGNEKPFLSLLQMSALKQADIPTGATTAEKLGIYIDALYDIDAARFTETNAVKNLLVGVTNQNPDIGALLDTTSARKEYKEKNVLAATLVAYDYRANDGYDGFRASDVAIIKVNGSNFPIVTLGAIDTIRQGADLLILGYPGNANENGIVEATSSQATLTTGKVSAIKNASGSDKKLIETDTTIGHGNSGGPAFDTSGNVVGIATYTSDTTGSGDGIYNYVRDIKDLKDLAAKNNLKFDTASKTQVEWQKGIDDFYASHYSQAVQHFKTVQQLYPNHSRVAELTAAAEKRIAEGKDIVDFPVLPIVVAASLLFVGSVTAIIVIAAHHKKYLIYKAGIAQGSVQPTKRGDPAQKVGVAMTIPVVSLKNQTPPAPVTKSEEPKQ